MEWAAYRSSFWVSRSPRCRECGNVGRSTVQYSSRQWTRRVCACLCRWSSVTDDIFALGHGLLGRDETTDSAALSATLGRITVCFYSVTVAGAFVHTLELETNKTPIQVVCPSSLRANTNLIKLVPIGIILVLPFEPIQRSWFSVDN